MYVSPVAPLKGVVTETSCGPLMMTVAHLTLYKNDLLTPSHSMHMKHSRIFQLLSLCTHLTSALFSLPRYKEARFPPRFQMIPITQLKSFCIGLCHLLTYISTNIHLPTEESETHL